MTHKRGPRQIAGELMDVRTAAQFLGVTERTLRARIARRLIPHRRMGSRIVFIRAELSEYVQILPGCSLDEVQANMKVRYDR